MVITWKSFEIETEEERVVALYVEENSTVSYLLPFYRDYTESVSARAAH